MCYREVDSDGDEVPGSDSEGSDYYGYQVWYSLTVKVSPPPPERSLEVRSACHVSTDSPVSRMLWQDMQFSD